MDEKEYVRRMWGIIGILLVVVLILAAGLKKSRTEENESMMVSDIPVGSLIGAALANEQGKIAFIIQEGEIQIIDAPDGAAFSDSVRKTFLYQMAHLPAVKSLGVTEDWKKYGLEDYRAAVVLLLKDGGRERLFLGDQAPFDSGWYLRREKDDSLYLIGDMAAEMMQYSLDDFRKVDVLPENSELLIRAMTRFTLTHQGETLDIRCEKKNGAVYYELVTPFALTLNWQKVQSELLEPFVRLKKKAFIGDEGAAEQYGFHGEDAYTLVIESGNQTTKLFFLPAKENDFYCTDSESGQVILVDQQDVDFLDCSVMDLMDVTLYSANAADIERVEVVADGLHGTLDISGQSETLHSYCNGVMMGQAETVELFQVLTMIPPAEPLDQSQELSGESRLSLYFRRRNGTEDLVSLIPVSDRRCAVMINGTASFTTYTATIDEIIRSAKRVFQN